MLWTQVNSKATSNDSPKNSRERGGLKKSGIAEILVHIQELGVYTSHPLHRVQCTYNTTAIPGKRTNRTDLPSVDEAANTKQAVDGGTEGLLP